MHQDRAGVLVHQSRDTPDVVDVGVGDDDPAYLQVCPFYSERDAGGLVAWIYQGAFARHLVPDHVAVLLKWSDGHHLEDHDALPRRNSTRRRVGAPVAPFGV